MRLVRTNGVDAWRVPAPVLGEHTVEVLAGLGYSPDEIQRLEQEGAICRLA